MARAPAAPAAETCNGHKITIDAGGAHVFDPKNPSGPALCRFATIEEARRWVRAAAVSAPKNPARRT